MSVPLFAGMTAALIFAVHPFQSEAINYLTSRSSLLSTFFILLAFWFWTRYRDRSSATAPDSRSSLSPYFASLLAYLLAMLSKETAIVFPALLILYDFYFPGSSAGRGTPERIGRARYLSWRYHLPYLPFVLAPLTAYIGVRLFVTHSPLPHFQRDLWTQVWTGLVSLVQYLYLFVVPVNLSLLRANEIHHTLISPKVLACGLLLLGLMGGLLWAARSNDRFTRAVSFFGLWFFVALLPTTLFPLNAVFQENRGYAAFLFFAVAVSWCLTRLYPYRRRAATVMLVFLVVGYGLMTVQRNGEWRDPVAFTEKEVRMNPGSSFAYGELARELLIRGDLDRAVPAAMEAISRAPRNSYLYFLLGDIYEKKEEPKEALWAYEKGLSLDPRPYGYYLKAGVLYAREGEVEKAERHLQTAVRRKPDEYLPHYNLAVFYQEQGRWEEAAREYRETLAQKPDHPKSRIGLGEVMERMGRGSGDS
ncbi:MAG: tetratricopeptide repeat protein [Nitrospirae bacterium]|nr:tetratricopeptide repeat protein [Nitrospirota bacterium]